LFRGKAAALRVCSEFILWAKKVSF